MLRNTSSYRRLQRTGSNFPFLFGASKINVDDRNARDFDWIKRIQLCAVLNSELKERKIFASTYNLDGFILLFYFR